MKRVLWLLAFVVGGFFIVRALMEPFVIDYSDPSSYENDWGGPSLIGVLLVHMGPGIIAAILLILALRRNDRRKATGGAVEDQPQ
jgi:drug/metabolite transporter superfamily protein YnfA